MKIFIQALHYDLWNIIVHGTHTPTKIINGAQVPKYKNEWNSNEKKLAQLNTITMNVLYCALDENQFNRICTYSSTKEI